MHPRDSRGDASRRRHQGDNSSQAQPPTPQQASPGRFVSTEADHAEISLTIMLVSQSTNDSNAAASLPYRWNIQSNDPEYDAPPTVRGPSQQQNGPSHRWHAVPRYWGTVNPNPNPDFAPFYPPPHHHHHNSHNHNFSNSSNAPQGEAGASHDPLRLTLENLQQFNSQRAPTDSMTMWGNESQRDAPWNGIGYVRREREDRRRNGPP